LLSAVKGRRHVRGHELNEIDPGKLRVHMTVRKRQLRSARLLTNDHQSCTVLTHSEPISGLRKRAITMRKILPRYEGVRHEVEFLVPLRVRTMLSPLAARSSRDILDKVAYALCAKAARSLMLSVVSGSSSSQ
jgi:hypothetical protein